MFGMLAGANSLTVRIRLVDSESSETITSTEAVLSDYFETYDRTLERIGNEVADFVATQVRSGDRRSRFLPPNPAADRTLR